MDPVVIIGGAVVLALVLRRDASDDAAPVLAPVTPGRFDAASGRAFGRALSGAATTVVAADGAFASRVEASSMQAPGYRGGASPPRVRSFAGDAGALYRRGRPDGLPAGISRVQVPWIPSDRGERRCFEPVGNVLTFAGVPSALGSGYGASEGDRWAGPALVFDGDDVAWVCDCGPGGAWACGDGAWLSVGMDSTAVMALDAEHQLTGATAEWSRAAWDLDAPRVVQRGGSWALEGFGASQLAEGQRLSLTLGRDWASRVNGGYGADVNSRTGATGRAVWMPLINRAIQTLGVARPESGDPRFDQQIWNR